MVDQTTYGKIQYRTGFNSWDRPECLDLLACAMENISQPFAVVHVDGRMLNYNTAFCDLVGFTREELSEMTWSSDLMPPEWREHEAKILADLLQNKNTVVRYRKEYFRKDGSRVPIELNVHVIMDISDNPLYYYVFYTDLTEIMKKEEELNDEKALAGLYLDLISHDVNNMYQVIRGYLELVDNNLKNNGKVCEDDFVRIKKSIEALDNSSILIENVNRIKQARSQEFSFKAIDICRILFDIIEQQSNVPDRIITINNNLDGQRFTCANEFLKDLFYNIIGNAIKHSPIDRPLTINIDVDGVVEKGRMYHRIAISDTGPGIPDDLKGQLFNRLQRGRTKASGKGLGLFLVKTLAESYKGQVRVEDRVQGDHGKGAKIIVLLPAIENKKPC